MFQMLNYKTIFKQKAVYYFGIFFQVFSESQKSPKTFVFKAKIVEKLENIRVGEYGGGIRWGRF